MLSYCIIFVKHIPPILIVSILHWHHFTVSIGHQHFATSLHHCSDPSLRILLLASESDSNLFHTQICHLFPLPHTLNFFSWRIEWRHPLSHYLAEDTEKLVIARSPWLHGHGKHCCASLASWLSGTIHTYWHVAFQPWIAAIVISAKQPCGLEHGFFHFEREYNWLELCQILLQWKVRGRWLYV